MELVEDKNVETMAALYCGNQSHQNVPIHLFAELVDVELAKNLTLLREEHRV